MSDDLWREYLTATGERDARPLLLRALAACDLPGRALDLGCGGGGDSLALLRSGYSVLAVDALPEALAHTRQRAEVLGLGARLETRCARFEELDLGDDRFALIHAGYSLPFCTPERFEGLWEELRGTLEPGGVFAGQLFGRKDAWCGDDEHPSQVFVTRADCARLLEQGELLHFQEERERRATALGGLKDWHLFHFLWRRR